MWEGLQEGGCSGGGPGRLSSASKDEVERGTLISSHFTPLRMPLIIWFQPMAGQMLEVAGEEDAFSSGHQQQERVTGE